MHAWHSLPLNAAPHAVSAYEQAENARDGEQPLVHDAHFAQADNPALVQGQLSVPQQESQPANAAASTRADVVAILGVLVGLMAQGLGTTL